MSREDSSMNLDVNVCKNQRRVCFIRGEEFQIVGTTIFIKKNASFCLYIYNFNPDFQNFDVLFPSYNRFKVGKVYETVLQNLENCEQKIQELINLVRFHYINIDLSYTFYLIVYH